LKNKTTQNEACWQMATSLIPSAMTGFFDKVPKSTFYQELREFLASLPQRKVIFTNAPESSAHEILDFVGGIGSLRDGFGNKLYAKQSVQAQKCCL
jgi:FMN phosphatase YigB (HAD superfamily)